MPKSAKCLSILEEECHKSLGVGLFLLQLFFHSLYCHLEEEADEVLVRCFRTNHASKRRQPLAPSGQGTGNHHLPHPHPIKKYNFEEESLALSLFYHIFAIIKD